MDEPAEYVGPLLEGYRIALQEAAEGGAGGSSWDAATSRGAAPPGQHAREMWRWMQVVGGEGKGRSGWHGWLAARSGRSRVHHPPPARQLATCSRSIDSTAPPLPGGGAGPAGCQRALARRGAGLPGGHGGAQRRRDETHRRLAARAVTARLFSCSPMTCVPHASSVFCTSFTQSLLQSLIHVLCNVSLRYRVRQMGRPSAHAC